MRVLCGVLFVLFFGGGGWWGRFGPYVCYMWVGFGFDFGYLGLVLASILLLFGFYSGSSLGLSWVRFGFDLVSMRVIMCVPFWVLCVLYVGPIWVLFGFYLGSSLGLMWVLVGFYVVLYFGFYWQFMLDVCVFHFWVLCWFRDCFFGYM